MWATVSLVLCVAILWQGLASGYTTTPFQEDMTVNLSISESDGGNIVLDPDKDSVLATLELLQNEHNQLKQDMQQSQAQIMSLVQNLQEENSQLRKQQENSQAMVSFMISNVSKEMMEHLQEVMQQVQTQVSELMGWVGEMKGQQEMLMEQAGLMQSVLEGVQEFEDWADNVTSHLTHIQDRLASVETTVLQLQGQGSDHAKELTAVQQRMDNLESLLQSGRGSEAPSTPSPTTPVASSPTTPATSPTTPATSPSTPATSPTTPATSPTTPATSPTTPATSPTTPVTVPSTSDAHVSTDAAEGQLQFTVPPNDDLWGDSLITSILVTGGGKLITGDLYQGKLTMSSLESPANVEDVYGFQKPWAMLELQDGTIAVTREYDHTINIFRITDDGLEHVRVIATTKTYFGIAQGPDDTLIVSDRTTEDTISSIDIIDMEGNIQRTILHDVEPLDDPYCLERFGDDVYVSDWSSCRVFRVNIYTGEVKFTIGELDLSDLEFDQPRKIDIDSNGNLYIATGGGVCNPKSFCIIQVAQSGSWQVMDAFVPQNGGGYPYGLELTSSQIIISWGRWDVHWSSELTSYSLPQLPEEPEPTEEGSEPTSSHKMCVHVLTTDSAEVNNGSSALTNVALNKPALQSTYHPRYGNPEKAVDGSRATAISQCIHTADVDSNPNRWWRVDLMGLFEVEAVVITNRGDCCGYRLTDFDIYVVETLLDPSERQHDPSNLCLHHDELIPDGATVRLECGRPIIGQYVSVVLRTDSWPLHFCEIEVLGRPAAERITSRPPSQSSTESTPVLSSTQSSSATTTPTTHYPTTHSYSSQSSSTTTPSSTPSSFTQSSSATTPTTHYPRTQSSSANTPSSTPPSSTQSTSEYTSQSTPPTTTQEDYDWSHDEYY